MERYMRGVYVVVLTIVLASASLAQTKRAMTIDDLIGAVRVGDPDLSPNGKKVLMDRRVREN
jgi:hypothetical protein